MTSSQHDVQGEALPEAPEALEAYFVSVLAQRLAPRDAREERSLLGIRDNDDPLGAGRAFLAELADLGWATPLWPTEYGGAGFTAAQATVLFEALERFQVPDLYQFEIALRMVSSVLIKYGTDLQRKRWLERIRVGLDVWAQLFSEPEAGSDLAGLTTRAAREEDGKWRVKGHKIWTSRAVYASWGLLLARSDEDVEKHAGLTAFALDMKSPGVVIRPIRQMNGDEHFAEVFLDDVVIPDDCRLGDVNDGWRVAMSTLSNERARLGGGGLRLGIRSRDLLLRLLEESAGAPALQAEVIDAFVELEVCRLTDARVAAKMRRGAQPGPEGSGAKLRHNDALRRLSDVVLRVKGPEGMVDDDMWTALALTVPSLGIRGGTDQVQKNIIGERVLGLPKEPSVERNRSFRDLRGRSA
jgi:alkylation response protein AidB-like acyl-CoA dehydrogenase